MKKRVLVTGGAGFIGSHMTEALLNRGHDVVIIDNESSGRRANVPDQAHYYRGDVRQPADLEKVFQIGLDAVFHIAGQASTIRSFDDPLEDLNVNTTGTVQVVQKCLAYRVPRLLYASSMTVYGHVARLPIHEETTCRPVSYYGITKYAAECYVHATAARPDLVAPFHVTSFRMFNVYGERQRLDNPYQGVMGIFTGNVLRQEPIVIHGDGRQSRDFIHISDVVDAWLRAWESPAAHDRVFNLGYGQNYSINELADTVLAALDRSRASYPVDLQPLRPGDQRHMRADIEAARSLLGWQPNVDFAEGVRRTIRWALATPMAAELAARSGSGCGR